MELYIYSPYAKARCLG